MYAWAHFIYSLLFICSLDFYSLQENTLKTLKYHQRFAFGSTKIDHQATAVTFDNYNERQKHYASMKRPHFLSCNCEHMCDTCCTMDPILWHPFLCKVPPCFAFVFWTGGSLALKILQLNMVSPNQLLQRGNRLWNPKANLPKTPFLLHSSKLARIGVSCLALTYLLLWARCSWNRTPIL